MSGTVIGIFCVAAFFLILALVLFTGRGTWLIAGYNTMKPEEKEKYDEKKLCRGTGILMLFFSVGCTVMAFAELFCSEAVVDRIAIVCLIVICIVCVGGIVLGNIFCRK